MLDFKGIIQNRFIRIVTISGLILVLIYVILRLTVFDTDPVLPFLDSLYKFYLLIPERVFSGIFNLTDAGVRIENHQLVFTAADHYHQAYNKFLEKWYDYLLYKNWSLLVLAVIWINFSTIRKKLFYTFIFVIVHIIAVVGGLYLLAVLGPQLIDELTDYFLSPTLFGTFVFYIYLVIWILINRDEIRNTLKKVGIIWNISDSRFFEVLLLLFLLLILKNFLIPFLPFKPYVHFLLEVSRSIATFFGYQGYIVGDQLQGFNGALALSKHCLGFVTMYLFGIMVFLTRPVQNKRKTFFYITFGMVLLFVMNIARLVLVFIVAQGPNGYERANIHHEVYNIAIYIFIFLLWVIWFEFFLQKKGKGAHHPDE